MNDIEPVKTNKHYLNDVLDDIVSWEGTYVAVLAGPKLAYAITYTYYEFDQCCQVRELGQFKFLELTKEGDDDLEWDESRWIDAQIETIPDPWKEALITKLIKQLKDCGYFWTATDAIKIKEKSGYYYKTKDIMRELVARAYAMQVGEWTGHTKNRLAMWVPAIMKRKRNA